MAQITCSNCGGSVDAGEHTCPYCGTALIPSPAAQSTPEQVSGGAPTMLSESLNAIVSPFNSSAEAMDEVKRLLRENKKAEAVQAYREYFKVGLKVAKQAVEQTETDMKYAPAPEPAAATILEPVAAAGDATTFTPVEPEPASPEPPKPSNRRNLIIGGSVAAVLFLCCCCCLPLVIALVGMYQSR